MHNETHFSIKCQNILYIVMDHYSYNYPIILYSAIYGFIINACLVLQLLITFYKIPMPDNDMSSTQCMIMHIEWNSDNRFVTHNKHKYYVNTIS